MYGEEGCRWYMAQKSTEGVEGCMMDKVQSCAWCRVVRGAGSAEGREW